MKRFALKLVLFLLLGAILNVAVAWAIAAWASPIGYPNVKNYVTISTSEAERFLNSRFPEAASVAQDRFPGIQANGIGRTATEFGARSEGSRCIITSDFGLPQRGMSMEWGDSYNDFHPSWYLPIPRWIPYVQFPDQLPLRPLWPGFAINTIFYAAILWLSFTMSGVFRRRRRIQRDLCPKCAYDLRGSASQTCPECGTRRTLATVH